MNTTKLFLFLALVFSSLSGFSVTETTLENIYFSDVVPILTENSKSLFFSGRNGKRIHFYKYVVPEPKGVLVVVPGQGESALKYAEFVYDLKDVSYDIFVIDHRGHGFSERLLADPEKCHVEDFGFYVDDLENLVVNYVRPQNYSNSALFGHSMGGAIVAGFLERQPKLFKKVVLSAPMMKINTAPFPDFVALKLARFLDKIGKSKEYAPTQKGYNPVERFEENTVTHSRTRFKLDQALERMYPQTIVAGTTVRWVKTNLEWTTRLRKLKGLLQVPTLIIQAGGDTWVKPEGQVATCRGSATVCQLYVIEDSKHGIPIESDKFRNLIFSRMQEFLNLPRPQYQLY